MRILIAGGGSGGHIFPAVAILPCLKDHELKPDIYFVGSQRSLDRQIFERSGVRFALLSSNKMPRGITLRWFVFIARMIADCCKGLSIVLAYRPTVIVGFGGYVSMPILCSGFALRIPCIIHEQNVVPGRANRALCMFADSVALSFSQTLQVTKGPRTKFIVTGNPVRSGIGQISRADALKAFGLPFERFTILVMGGSQGSHHINTVFAQAVKALADTVKSRIQIIHLSGESDRRWLEEGYRTIAVPYRVFSFIDSIDQAYGACDLAVTRGGSSALFELAMTGKPMVVIPYPYASGHQTENARVFVQNGAAVSVEESVLTVDGFRDLLTELIRDTGRLDSLSKNVRELSTPHACERLSEEIVRLAHGRV